MSINNILYFNYGEYQFQLYEILFTEYIDILNLTIDFKFISTLKNKQMKYLHHSMKLNELKENTHL